MAALPSERMELRTLKEAAAGAGVSRATLWRWLRAGKIRRYRVAGDRRVFVDLDQILDLRRPREEER